MSRPSKVLQNNIYSDMDFPDYEYRPYPKLIYADDGVTFTRVENEEEEAKLKKAAPTPDAVGAVAVADVSVTLGKTSAPAAPRKI